jgi:hypothetical protein
MNSLPVSNIRYLIIICIDSVQIRPNSLWQTKHGNYLAYVAIIHFYLSLICASKAGAYPSGAPYQTPL